MSVFSMKFLKGRKSAAAWASVLAASVMYSEVSVAQLEEVVVTATKRTTSLQDVGVSVNAFNGDTLERLGLKDSQEVLLKVPNLEIQANAGSTNANIFLRGIGTSGIGLNVQSGVGIYADEVALNSPVVNILQVYDVERVEVLAGPQNTLYGRNTTGGAVNFISRKPEIGGETNGRLSLTYGRFNQFDIDGAVGAPIGENAAIRFAAQANYRDGIRDNLVTGREDFDRDKIAGRVQLAFAPSDTVDVNLKAHIERVRGGNLRFKQAGTQDPNDPSQPCATPFVLGACANAAGFVDSGDPEVISSDMFNPENDVDAGGASAHVVVDFDSFTLTSITAYEENEQALSEDSDAGPAHDFHFFINSEQEQFSQEFRLASADDAEFRWIVGAYGFWEEKSGTTGPTWATPMGTMLVQSQANFDNTTYSGYVDLEYDLTEKLTLKGGYRLSSDTIEGNTIALFAFESALGGLDITSPSLSGAPLPSFDALLAAAESAGALVIRVGGPTDPTANINDTTFDEWGGKLGVDFRPVEGVLTYAQWSRGFKAGVFPNAAMAIMQGAGDIALEPEIVDAYEIGLKSEFADGRARLNMSIFFNDYQDQQINQFILGEFRAVSADSEIYGADVNFNWVPVDGTFIDVGMGYIDSEIVKPPEGSEEQEGNILPNAPEFSTNLAIRREWETGNGGLVGIGADGRYASKRFFNLANSQGDGSYYTLNAQAFYEFGEDGQYRFTVWGKNITDELYYNNRFDGLTAGAESVYMSEPATYGVSLNAKF